MGVWFGIRRMLFQSTHSLRSATRKRRGRPVSCPVSIHALLAECDFLTRVAISPLGSFNPRTPCGVRRIRNGPGSLVSQFQSTHSLRSATISNRAGGLVPQVSIHALLAECDWQDIKHGRNRAGFNPRTPCGVRHLALFFINCKRKFQSTHSLRSATLRLSDVTQMLDVSIHALLAECDF